VCVRALTSQPRHRDTVNGQFVQHTYNTVHTHTHRHAAVPWPDISTRQTTDWSIPLLIASAFRYTWRRVQNVTSNFHFTRIHSRRLDRPQRHANGKSFWMREKTYTAIWQQIWNIPWKLFHSPQSDTIQKPHSWLLGERKAIRTKFARRHGATTDKKKQNFCCIKAAKRCYSMQNKHVPNISNVFTLPTPLPPPEVCEVLWSACLSVCLSPCISQVPYVQIFVHVSCGRGLVDRPSLTVSSYVTYFRFVNDVIMGRTVRHGVHAQNSTTVPF